MTRLPVHCCCDPTRRLGWVEVQEAKLGPIAFAIPARWTGGLGVTSGKQTIHTSILMLRTREAEFPAVKSAHLSIDVWRQVPGFTVDL